MSSANGSGNFSPPSMGCMSEHLNYFSDNIASSQPILEGDFDALFNRDFDLVFDPVLLMNSDSATVARPVNHQRQVNQPLPIQRLQPSHSVPITVASGCPSAKVVAPSQPTSSRLHTMPTPATAGQAVVPQPIVKVPTRKPCSPQVSPTSVTAVFESIPTPAKSSPRKRRYSSVQSSHKPASVTSSPPPTDASNLSFQEQEDLRRERNRHHAKRSRQRKRDYMNSLEEAVNEMRKENERLFDLLGMDSRRAKDDMAQEEERKREIATEKFILGLKQPRNRVLDNTTLAFLRELWK